MDYVILLLNHAILAIMVTIATDNFTDIFNPWLARFENFKLESYKLTIAFIFVLMGMFAVNIGILEVMQVLGEDVATWAHIYDLILSALVLTKGAQGLHKLFNKIADYTGKRNNG